MLEMEADDVSFDPGHAIAVLTRLWQIYKHGTRTDLVVLVGERRFEVHGCVLMCGSEFFRTQLETGVGISSMHEVALPEMSARAFELIVGCLYTGVLASIDESNVMELLEASQRLQIPIAETQCCEWIEQHLDASSALVVWESARRLGCEAMQAKAWPLLGLHLQQVARQETFLALPQPLLVELMCDDSLAVRSEVTVYEAVMAWVRSDEAERKGAIGEVLGTVRLGLLPATYLAKTVATDPLIAPSLEANRLLAEAQFLVCHDGANLDGTVSGSLMRKRNRPADAGLMVAGGFGGFLGNLASVECYEQSTQWRALPQMSVARGGCAAACVDGLAYVVGGSDGDFNSLASAECFDPLKGQWRSLPDMSVARYGCAAACCDGLLFVLGGGDADENNLASAEIYDPSMRQWRSLPDMSIARRACAAACVDGFVYVVGGEDPHREILASAERYDPSTEQWQVLPEMAVARFECAAACINGLLYVVGGFDGDYNSLANAECYDPSIQQWKALPDMSVARRWCAATCVDGLLYVVGGEDAAGNDLASAEFFDASTREWRALPADMSVVRCGGIAVCLP